MKTPRKILFQRHEGATPKLDALREEVLQTQLRPKKAPPVNSWREWLLGFRPHFAAMSAVWIVVLLLHLSDGAPPGPALAVAGDKIPPPRLILAALRENRRQLLELIGPRDAEPPKSLPQPRSEWSYPTLMA
jgi:hypothetical protein